ncbi:MAG TPA: NAD(P)H-dependent oxidoreductase subunit E [Desulfosporosinus sp.]|nr:NAD(P)H-dependent oxidoreductase subunit E [Desulfosporosinus sp.]
MDDKIQNRGGNMENEKKMKEIIFGHSAEKRYSLAIMQDIQREFNYIPREAMETITEYLSIPLSKLYGMATFYKALSLKPKGKYVIKVCDGTACHIRSSMVIVSEMEKLLGIEVGGITPDGLFSIETVNCLGACALAPVMVINGEYYGKLTTQDIVGIIERYKGGEVQ